MGCWVLLERLLDNLCRLEQFADGSYGAFRGGFCWPDVSIRQKKRESLLSL